MFPGTVELEEMHGDSPYNIMFGKMYTVFHTLSSCVVDNTGIGIWKKLALVKVLDVRFVLERM